MSRIIFLLEEPSMGALLDGVLRRLFPNLEFLCIPHEGKQDLEKSIPRKLKAWNKPDDRFVVLRDKDNDDCHALKTRLSKLCTDAGRPETLVRIVCQELEAWYIGDPHALAVAFSDERLRTIGGKARYRDPDDITKPSLFLARLYPNFQKVSGARALGQHMSYQRSKSRSFRVLIDGIERISGQNCSEKASSGHDSE
jgi:hypothetical protein